MKTCIKCNVEKPESDFYETWYVRKDGTKSRTQKCKPCVIATSAKQREGDKRNRYLAYQKVYKTLHDPLRRGKRIAKMDEIKNRPCEDCASKFPPECMDWDHIDPQTKSFNISQAVVSGNSWTLIMEEVAKCRLICANCHRIRTARQQNRYRHITLL